MTLPLAQTVSLAAAAYLLAACMVLGRRKAGYSHCLHTISELGERGACDARFVALGLFLPVGLLLLAAAAVTWRGDARAGALALCIGVGYLGAACFPCDPGSPRSGSWRQGMHNLAGGVQYIGGAMALMALAPGQGMVFQLAGAVVLGCGIAIGLLSPTAWRGALQRVAEVCLFAGLAYPLW